MKRLIMADASISLGLAAWLAAAALLPFHLGASGAGLSALMVYVVVAGVLLTLGELASGNVYWRGGGDFLSQALLRALGLSIPAMLFLALGSLAAPAAERLEDDVCALAGYAEAPDGGAGSADMAIDGSADCLPPDGLAA